MHEIDTKYMSVCKNFLKGHRKTLIDIVDKIQEQGNTMECSKTCVEKTNKLLVSPPTYTLRIWMAIIKLYKVLVGLDGFEKS